MINTLVFMTGSIATLIGFAWFLDRTDLVQKILSRVAPSWASLDDSHGQAPR